MKPFTFMTIGLGLILGFLLLSGRSTHVVHPAAPVASPVFIQTRYDDPDRGDSDARDEREEAEDLPVPIVPGTRVDEAEIAPPRRARAKTPSILPPNRVVYRGRVAYSHSSAVRTIAGRLSATEDRARDDVRRQLEREVTDWLTPEVPSHWTPPSHAINAMILDTQIKPIVRDYGTVYEATVEADFSTDRRDDIRSLYQRELVGQRLTVLGGSLGFILACLAALAGYIRADEATKGYYTPWLRAVAAAGVGASGVLIYQLLA